MTTPLWYLIIAPISIAVTLFGLWLSQKGERRRRVESDARLHGAMFGYQEGITKVPGIFDIVVADGNGGSLSAIVKATRQAANNAVVVTSGTQRIVNDLTAVVAEHIADDRQIWNETSEALIGLDRGQKAAVQTAKDVAAVAETVAATLAHLTEETAAAVKTEAQGTAADVAEMARIAAEQVAEAQSNLIGTIDAYEQDHRARLAKTVKDAG
jgi:hypothetical protein